MDRTEVKIEPTIKIDKASKILSLGSCFADRMGSLMGFFNYQEVTNPFGILFNPVSLDRFIGTAMGEEVEMRHYGEHQGVFFHYDFHSRANGENRQDVKDNIRMASDMAGRVLRGGDYLFLTFGTAWVWRLIETNQIIANCHKMPQNLFQKELLQLDELKDRWKSRIHQLLRYNPQLKIVLTVSPVRHTRNGMHEDKLSKSMLLLLCDVLEKEFDQVYYFPAYEVIIDEFRDYAYYEDDLIHPTGEAVYEVYKKFCCFAQIPAPPPLSK